MPPLAGYELLLGRTLPPPPSEMSAAELAWVGGRLRDAGLRPT